MLKNQILEEKIMPDFTQLGCESMEEYNEIMTWINTERWKDLQEEVLKDELDHDEYEKYVDNQNKHRGFDIFKDWDAYYVDFKRIYNIDLIEIKYLDWFRFSWLLTGLFNIEDTMTHKRSYARSVDLNKIDKSMRAGLRQQKDFYSLEEITVNNPFIGKENINEN